MGIHRIKILNAVEASAEATLEATYTCSGTDSAKLCAVYKGLLVLTAGTETGACDLTVDTLQACYDAGDATNWVNIETSIAKQFTGAGSAAFVLAGTYGLPHYLKILVTATQVSSSHKFATFTAEMQFSTQEPN